MKKKHLKGPIVTVSIVAFLLLLFVWLNPGRADFNHAVFEGGKPNPITDNQQIMNRILEINTACYQNENDSRVQRRNYILCSIFDVKVSNTETYHILGILQNFGLLES